MPDRFTLISPRVRQNAVDAIRNAPQGYRVTISQPNRSLDQNAKLWAMLGDVANSKPEGRHWTPETWKCAFMHALGHQVRFADGLDDSGPFPIGFHSSTLTVKEMADLITCVQEYGDRHGVDWKDVQRGGFDTEPRAA